ncbi:hypothetical protein [Hymenobacter metallicola]|uniref:Uncharacterized protein n=1 Tax=Hymenobacter metallicola TaxID=2563114 RepID=A0A4Z0QKU8_9BACT|nr:hypothetical protein [Hymenobacter metallicola]TGE29879.1 hypothetical protein E5K02_10595 [Hymenobacter metallicola]
MKWLLYLSLTALWTGCAEKKPAARQFRFYDFDLIVTIRDAVGGIRERYILANLKPTNRRENSGIGPAVRLGPDTLHLVKYATSSNRQKRIRQLADPRDTTRLALRPGQLDTLYSLTTALFALPPAQNLTPDSLPPPPAAAGDLSATVELNLGPRGNHYKAFVPNTAHHFALHAYLLRLVAQYRRQHPPVT